MRLLTFTTLYPSAARPTHGIFVETRLRELVRHGGVESVVVAPVPWFPFRHRGFGHYAEMARTPRDEHRNGLRVLHPRYPTLPRIGMTLAPFLLAAAVAPGLARLIRDGYDFDVIDAHYFYPDGVAAAMLGARLRKPVVITARGSDVNLFPRFAIPRRLILWAARKAAAIVTVSAALRDALIALGAPGERVRVLRNGVDLERFTAEGRPMREAGSGPALVSVGNLKAMKGHDLAIRALEHLPGASLEIVGGGGRRAELEALAASRGLAGRVRFAGVLDQGALAARYRAADVLVLASSREGWPNVLLEAMACGTPVVATGVGGVPEIVGAPEAGRIPAQRTPEALAAAVRELVAAGGDPAATGRYAEGYGWGPTTRGQVDLFEGVLAGRATA